MIIAFTVSVISCKEAPVVEGQQQIEEKSEVTVPSETKETTSETPKETTAITGTIKKESKLEPVLVSEYRTSIVSGDGDIIRSPRGDLNLLGDFICFEYYVNDTIKKELYCGYKIIDIEDIKLPKEIYDYKEDAAWWNWSSLVDDFLYVAAGPKGLKIIDLTNPKVPVLIGSCKVPSGAMYVQIKDDYAYVADALNGLQIIDISDKKNPYIIGNVDVKKFNENEIGTCGSVFVKKDFALLFYSGWLEDEEKFKNSIYFVDIKNKKNPMILSKFETNINKIKCDITEDGNYLILLGNDYFREVGQIQIFDISDTENPIMKKTLDVQFSSSYCRDGNFMYIKNNEKEISIINLENINNPKIISSIKGEENILYFWVENDLAYLSVWNTGLLIFDLDNKKNPRVKGICTTPVYIQNAFVNEDFAFIGYADFEKGETGVQIFRLK